MESEKVLNQRLIETFGKDVNGNAKYRLVQNTKNLTEKRTRQIDLFRWETSEYRKYNYIPDDYWILEQLFYTDSAELTTKATYEPVWVFIAHDGSYQEPVYNALVFIIKSAQDGPKKVIGEQEQSEKTVKELFEYLGGKAGPMDGTTADGSAISMSGLDAQAATKES